VEVEHLINPDRRAVVKRCEVFQPALSSVVQSEQTHEIFAGQFGSFTGLRRVQGAFELRESQLITHAVTMNSSGFGLLT
jgi:hypothetical protein